MVYSGNFQAKLKYIPRVDVSLNILQPVPSTRNRFFLSFFFFFLPPPPLLFFRTVKFRRSRSTRIGPNKQPSRRPSLVSWWIFHVEYVPSCLIRYESLMFQLFFFLFFPFFFSSTVQLCRIISQVAIIRIEIFFF